MRKKMDKENINTVGQKLGVGLSDIPKSRKDRFSRILCGFVQGLIVFGSILLGINYGMAGPGYPFAYSPWIDFGKGSFFEAVINAGNGIYLVPTERRFGFTRSQRIKFFWGNLVLSVALYIISFSVAWKIRSGAGTRYSVYDNQSMHGKYQYISKEKNVCKRILEEEG